MKLKQIRKIFGVTIATLSIFTAFISPAVAVDNQSNQGTVRPAILIAPEPNFKINVYPKPSTDKRRIGYGLAGNLVRVSEQVGSNEGYTWNHVKFDTPSNLEGWIREDFVSFQIPTIRSANPSSQSSKQTYQSNFDQQNKGQNKEHVGSQKNTFQSSYQRDRQRGNESQKQNYSQDKLSAVKEKVLSFFKK